MAEGNNNKIEPLYMQFRVQNIKDQFTKLNIVYSDVKKEILFQKIRTIFYNPESGNTKEIESSIVEEKQESYEDRRIREINQALNQYKNR